MKDSGLKELMENSIEVKKGMKVTWPLQGNRVGKLDMSNIVGKYLGRNVFSVNNSTLAFIYKGKFYVTPYTREALETLENEGFENEGFYVPCSNGDMPQKELTKWQKLREKALKTYESTFASECKEWCEEHHIHEISDRALSLCLEVPEDGIVIDNAGVKITFYPILDTEGMVDESVAKKLGHYCRNKNVIVFVYRNGKTYIAKGHWILTELNLAGFLLNRNFVIPFMSKMEEIVDPILRSKFAALPNAL